MSQLGNALFTTTQQKVLALLYAQPNKSFYTKEILRLTGMGVATIKRELDRMLSVGILTMTPIGNQHHYQANQDCPIYFELLGIVKKTFGIMDELNLALLSLRNKIEWAFIFGSVASDKETAASDIDLMVIGEVNFSDVVRALYSAQEKLGREINPKIYKQEEWMQMLSKSDTFVKEVLSKPTMDVIGKGNELR